MPPSLIGLVDCNHFYASCEHVFYPTAEHIIVGSNNDGCAIALSPGAREHVPMGAPLFQHEDTFVKHNISVFSANFALYADFSNRVTASLKTCVPDVYWYSIDESFATFPDIVNAREVQQRIEQWTGIRTSIGIAETKTLAKLANHVAKKQPEHAGDYSLRKEGRERDHILESFDDGKVWGIGSRWRKRLNMLGIKTDRELKDATQSGYVSTSVLY